jgi:hypothetical protein
MMNGTALVHHHAICCTNECQRELFDSVFQRHFVGDEGGFY